MLPLDGQETRAEKTNVTVDILTEFYARYPGLPSRFRNDTAPGQQTGRLSARPRPPSVAISVGTTPMIAIPVAAFMGSVAMIVGPAPQTWCNHFGLSRPMIAIPTADDCGSLHLGADVAPGCDSSARRVAGAASTLLWSRIMRLPGSPDLSFLSVRG